MEEWQIISIVIGTGVAVVAAVSGTTRALRREIHDFREGFQTELKDFGGKVVTFGERIARLSEALTNLGRSNDSFRAGQERHEERIDELERQVVRLEAVVRKP